MHLNVVHALLMHVLLKLRILGRPLRILPVRLHSKTRGQRSDSLAWHRSRCS